MACPIDWVEIIHTIGWWVISIMFVWWVFIKD